ncbi:TNFAIP3-interacting protein 2 isoform X2 [Thunnus albacares]|uniref:TNFAIP3-interacting protein 2 isoform X2 n=1 Tax=Thunnus maccoyii TaxID=8240 RepID=UPI001C4D608B|nr:TNFAIP3-interacting protein 2 isoform X2 [Thunnus maccoyii]XP_044203305.1 TNFAIP3-interacting protein 2 isoform X2 [Thunnus albacares]
MDSVSMNTDNDMLKDKNRSYSTLNTLYHETRQEIDLLNKQIFVKDNIIADLKTRLGRYERIYMTVGDKESVVIGPSKSLLESLCKEVCKLKQKRNEVEFKAAKLAEEIKRLNGQLREKELELESIRCQPDHEKDQEIQRLRLALEDRERSEATRAVLCNSLAEEADQLRNQLGATVKVCQELLARLEKEKKGGGEVEEMAQQQKAKELTDCSDRSSVNTQICQLKEENQQLKQRVAYVQGLNSQWQKYDSSREDYIRGLCQRLKETTGQGLMPGLGSVNTGLLHQEISRLNGLLEDKMSECARLGREVEEIRRHDQERIQTLEQQVLIYTDDFKSERADRERAQSQIQDLKDQVYQLKQQLHKQGASRESREVVPMCRVHIGHRISSRRHKDSAEHLLRTNTEAQQQPAAATVAPNPVWNEYPGLSELQCPRCLTKFDDMDAAEYLNHCEECAKL